jgi:hypothetical protein
MSINQLAKKHGLAVARVAGEEDPYASLVNKAIGPPTLLKCIFAPPKVLVNDDEKLRDIVTKALSSAGIGCTKFGLFAAREVNNLSRVIGECVKPSPEFQPIYFDGSELLLVASNGVNINAELKRVFMSKRVRSAIEKSKVKTLVDKEVEEHTGVRKGEQQ